MALPALMQDVQTFIRLAWPETAARTRWMLGFQRRLVFFFDHGTLWPKPGLLPHTSHTAATGVRSHLPLDIDIPVRATCPAYPSRLLGSSQGDDPLEPPSAYRARWGSNSAIRSRSRWIGLRPCQARSVNR